LFFVLSGFLISGLLFAEYRRSGAIRFQRFAVRRALKIYPAFYALVLLTVFSHLLTENPASVFRAFLHDVFFMQSYTPGTYGHFWSLSVEEHFYILFPLALYLMLRRSGPKKADPFQFLPWCFGCLFRLSVDPRLFCIPRPSFTEGQIKVTDSRTPLSGSIPGVPRSLLRSPLYRNRRCAFSSDRCLLRLGGRSIDGSTLPLGRTLVLRRLHLVPGIRKTLRRIH